MAWEEVGRGDLLDLNTNLKEYNNSFPEGARGILQLNLRGPATLSMANQLKTKLQNQGIPDVRITRSTSKLNVHWKKTAFWLIAIVAVILALIFLAMLIVTWQLFKEIGPVASSLFAIASIGALAIVGLYLFKPKNNRKAVTRAT